MNKATKIMAQELKNLNIKTSRNMMISNVTAKEVSLADDIKQLLVEQIENRVRWRESVINIIQKGVNQFIEIGPGKVLSGLVKRIDKSVEVSSINTEDDIKSIKI